MPVTWHGLMVWCCERKPGPPVQAAGTRGKRSPFPPSPSLSHLPFSPCAKWGRAGPGSPQIDPPSPQLSNKKPEPARSQCSHLTLRSLGDLGTWTPGRTRWARQVEQPPVLRWVSGSRLPAPVLLSASLGPCPAASYLHGPGPPFLPCGVGEGGRRGPSRLPGIHCVRAQAPVHTCGASGRLKTVLLALKKFSLC